MDGFENILNQNIDDKTDPASHINKLTSSNSFTWSATSEFENQKSQPVIGDQADFIKLFHSMKKSQQESKRKKEMSKVSLKKKMAEKKEGERPIPIAPIKTDLSKSSQILKVIEPHIKNFRALNSSSDSEVGKLRTECKEKLFKYLLYGMQQYKYKKEEELNTNQKNLMGLSGKQQYAVAKTIVQEIDQILLKTLNSGHLYSASKKYKTIFKALGANIADETNFQLRTKLLTKQISPLAVSTMNEEDFYSPELKQKLVEKQQILLRQASTDNIPTEMISEQEEAMVPMAEDRMEEEQKKVKYEFLEYSTMKMLHQFLDPNYTLKMKNMLNFDMNQSIKDKLMSSYNQNFPHPA